MSVYGMPDEVLTDNAKQFTGRFGKPGPAEVLFERICRRDGIPLAAHKPYSPTTTGKVQRRHQALQDGFLDGKGRDSARLPRRRWMPGARSTTLGSPHQSLDMATPR
jgi:hypothetical protein